MRLLAFFVCLWGLHPHDLAVDGWPADTQPSAIQVPTSSRALENNNVAGKRSISIVGDEFFLDGKPLQILSGSVHYFRMPAEYWRDRLRKVKAAGLNAVATYVEWSYHEPEERQYRFSGDYDVAQFVRIAAEEGLLVLLRPGPYICAERDLGGLPYWLLHKYPHIRLRTTDKDFIEESRIWFAKLFEHMTSLLYENGGPIILVQVENEYGSYGSDMPYKEQVRDIIQSHVNHKALLYTTDGYSSYMIRGGMVQGALPTIDFGVDLDIKSVFNALRRIMPHGPLMNSEFYPGWLTHWGEALQQVDKNQVVHSLRDMIDNKINVNMYVFHGGSNFEFSSGANTQSRTPSYQPDITSYDYDAPLDEAGDPTPKYYAIRELMETYNASLRNSSLPMPSPKKAYGKLQLNLQINLMSAEGRSELGKKYDDVTGATLPTFEKLKQRGGLVLYETTLSKPKGMLEITDPRDRIYVYLDGELKGIIDRMAKRHTLTLNSESPESILSLLVENQGRINYGQKLHDFKGILSQVTFNNYVLNGKWSITGFPIEQVEGVKPASHQSPTNYGPTLYVGSLVLPEGQEPKDTYLDPTGWGKGYVWVNGHNLGRYWPGRGPQVTLFVPRVWLRAAPAHNTVQLLELERAPDSPAVEFLNYFILNRTAADARLGDPNGLIFGV
ncbi:hypothetical protein O0L34_g7143 [Tuta absoluta]|nr:hypothetical protein O0L34_g7143 [Tuta absoluta]